MGHHEALKPFPNIYDIPFWEHVKEREFLLQTCVACGKRRFPGSPVCDDCLSPDYLWEPASGLGTVESWVVYRRSYFSAYPAPYNVVLVRLDEGPLFVSNLLPLDTTELRYQMRVRMVFDEVEPDIILPRFVPVEPAHVLAAG